MWFWIGGAVAVAAGIYVGLGMPGLPGRTDRVVPPGQARRVAKPRGLDYFKPNKKP